MTILDDPKTFDSNGGTSKRQREEERDDYYLMETSSKTEPNQQSRRTAAVPTTINIAPTSNIEKGKIDYVHGIPLKDILIRYLYHSKKKCRITLSNLTSPTTTPSQITSTTRKLVSEDQDDIHPGIGDNKTKSVDRTETIDNTTTTTIIDDIPDDITQIQNIFKLVGKPFASSELDELPQTDVEWDCLLDEETTKMTTTKSIIDDEKRMNNNNISALKTTKSLLSTTTSSIIQQQQQQTQPIKKEEL